jgi:hypothetical protein
MVYLLTKTVTWTIQLQVIQLSENSEFEKMWKEAITYVWEDWRKP